MTSRHDYRHTLDLLEELYTSPVLPARTVGLSRAVKLLELVGNPHRGFRAVVITGSTGKGSTTTMIGSILECVGYRTGYFRSPHLSSFTERIAVDGLDIAEQAWCEHFGTVWPHVQAMSAGEIEGYALGRPSFTEVLFTMAALHFKRERVAWAAVEVGMGGRYDAANVLAPEVAVVTNVSLEHTHVLGKTVKKIASEKAAIIKSGSSAVTAARDPDALGVIGRRAREVGAPLLVVHRDLALDSHPTGEQETEVHIRGLDLDLLVRLPSPAKFQVENAATAAATASALRRRGVPISDDAIRSGLERLAVAGRFEVVQRRPLVVLDGAHNPAGAVACREVLDSRFPDRAVTLVFAALADKDVDQMAAVLAPRARRIILTRAPGTSRAIPPDRLLEAFGDARGRCTTVESPDEAVSLGMSDLSEDGLLVVCGSLYLVGYVRKHVFAGVAV